MALTADSVYGFSKTLLASRYDDPVPIPDLHREMWDMCCSDAKQVAIAAPRGHAKSTAITHAYVLAEALYRNSRYILIISETEDQSANFLEDIKSELIENKNLIKFFEVRKIIRERVTDIIVELEDGYQFRIQALSIEKKVRGRKWQRVRPDLLVMDDGEGDEQVESKERRTKLRLWFNKALMPCMSRSGKIRVVGTILHLDSLLMSLIKSDSWYSRLYKAHKSFDDFSELLWPEMWPKERLLAERQRYLDDGIPEGYSQEYLNNPIDHSNAFFRRDEFLEADKEYMKMPVKQKEYYAAMDFAISEKDHGDYTVIVVGSYSAVGELVIEDVVRFREGDIHEIITRMFQVQKKYDINIWLCEKGTIYLGIEGELYKRMMEENITLNIQAETPKIDKVLRARPIQGRMRAGGVFFDKEKEWYSIFEEELLQFPKGGKKDQVDAFAWLGTLIHTLAESATQEEIKEEEYQNEYDDSLYMYGGINETTGY